MTDFILWAQFLMLTANIIVFIFIMQSETKLKFVKVLLLIIISLGTIINIGKLTWLNVIFSLTPGLLLFKKRKDKESTTHNLV